MFGQLTGAFVQLRGHLAGFFGRTAERNQSFGNFGDFHSTDLDRINKILQNQDCILFILSILSEIFSRGGNDFDADDADAFLRFALLTGAAGADRRTGDFRQYIIPFDQFAERGVLAVKE